MALFVEAAKRIPGIIGGKIGSAIESARAREWSKKDAGLEAIFDKDREFFDALGIYEDLEAVLGVKRFLRSAKVPRPLRFIPVWTPEGYISPRNERAVVSSRTESPTFFALVRWNLRMASLNGYSPFTIEDSLVQTWMEIKVVPQASDKSVLISAARDVLFTAYELRSRKKLLSVLREARDNPAAKFAPTDDYYARGLNSSSPNYPGFRL